MENLTHPSPLYLCGGFNWFRRSLWLSLAARHLARDVENLQHSIFRAFFSHCPCCLPLPPTCLPLFISYLTLRKLALSAITSYLSAISYVNKLRGLHDPTKSFLIQMLLTALSRRQPVDIRLPVTRPVLHELVRALSLGAPGRWRKLRFLSISITQAVGRLIS